MARNDSGTQNGVESIDEQRAVWEDFAFAVCKNGIVNVENLSHGDESGDHIHSVNPEAGTCTCKHYKYRNPDGGCKHIRAVRNAPLIDSSARASAGTKQVASDGGLPEITHHVEAPEFGGETYARCEGCGNESVGGPEHILHKDTCPHTEGRQEPTRSEPADFGHGESTGIDEL